MPEWRNIQDALMAGEFLGGGGMPCSCGRSGAKKLFRYNDCFQSPLVFAECVMDQHACMPFHWIQQWNGRFFEKLDLSTLGLELNLGHDGRLCPEPALNRQSRESEYGDSVSFTVVHTNGIHQCRINRCDCVGHKDVFSQLLEFGIFPSTRRQPRLGFTVATLRDYRDEALNNAAKTSVHDYIDVLRRQTNNVLPDTVSVSFNSHVYLIDCLTNGMAAATNYSIPSHKPSVEGSRCRMAQWQLPRH